MCTFERDEYCVNIIVLFSYKKNNELMCNYMLWMVQMLHTVYRAEGSASECLLGKLVFWQHWSHYVSHYRQPGSFNSIMMKVMTCWLWVRVARRKETHRAACLHVARGGRLRNMGRCVSGAARAGSERAMTFTWPLRVLRDHEMYVAAPPLPSCSTCDYFKHLRYACPRAIRKRSYSRDSPFPLCVQGDCGGLTLFLFFFTAGLQTCLGISLNSTHQLGLLSL